MSTDTSPSRPCLLLVDDTPANIDILVGLLKADFDLKVANRGAKALQICQSGARIDLVLLDVMMPEMDGFEVCRKLRAAPETRDLPVIFLTAKSELDDVVQGFEFGANDYLTKPFRPTELLARVRTHLTIRQQQQEIAAKNVELTELLHIVCHDVANQFAVASMAMDIIANHPEQDFKRFLPRVEAAVKNGVGLTNLVRELRRAEEKTLDLQPVSLRGAIDEALNLCEDRRQAKHLTVRMDVPDRQVIAEPFSLISSVLGNIFSNAIKFSRDGQVIDVSSRVENDFIGVTVRDHGIGIPESMLRTLFDVTKSHSRLGTAGERGTGFGMPLMSKFVRQFGGRVDAVSQEETGHAAEAGTAITVWLKIAT